MHVKTRPSRFAGVNLIQQRVCLLFDLAPVIVLAENLGHNLLAQLVVTYGLRTFGPERRLREPAASQNISPIMENVEKRYRRSW